MSDLAMNIIINVVIGICVVIGFLYYLNRTEGWFKEGRNCLRMVERKKK